MYGSLGSEAWLSSLLFSEAASAARAHAFSWIGRTLRRTDLLGVLRKLLIMRARNMGIVNLCSPVGRSCERAREKGVDRGLTTAPLIRTSHVNGCVWR